MEFYFHTLRFEEFYSVFGRGESLREIANEYLHNLLKTCEKNNGKIFVAEDGGKIVGMIAVVIHNQHDKLKPHGAITDLIVLPEYRDKGVGKNLINKAEKYIKDSGIDIIQASILSPLIKAQHMYTRNGYEEYEMILRKRLK
jgi:ribosomal protein S18 acetylase RimI-like enzyme